MMSAQQEAGGSRTTEDRQFDLIKGSMMAAAIGSKKNSVQI